MSGLDLLETLLILVYLYMFLHMSFNSHVRDDLILGDLISPLVFYLLGIAHTHALTYRVS